MLLHYFVKVKTENVILQQDIYHQRKLLQMYHSFIKVDQGHHVPYIYLFGVLYSKVCVKQRFMTLMTCENARCKLFLTLTGTCVHAGGGQFECVL